MFKALFLASVFFTATVVEYAPQQAEACGVKLPIGAKRHRIKISASKNPSQILVVGNKDSSLIKDLKSARHKVEYAATVDEAKDKKFNVVVADKSQMDAARQRFASARIVQKKNRGTMQNVEYVLARRAVNTGGQGTAVAVAAKAKRQPVQTGGVGLGDKRVRTDSGSEAPAVKVSAEPSSRVSASTTQPAQTETKSVEAAPRTAPVKEAPGADTPRKETKVAAVKARTETPRETREPATESPQQAAKRAEWTREFQFGTNSTRLNEGAKRRLMANVRWLEQNPNASIVIEGHTDSVGDEVYNLDLSERRANIARVFLLELGVDESRITVEAKGEVEPAYMPSTSAKNRRIILVKQ